MAGSARPFPGRSQENRRPLHREERFIGGTGVSEAFSEGERPKWTGRFHSAWYAGFILAAAILPFIVDPIGWRGVFFIGLAPAGLLFYIRVKAQEPEKWVRTKRRMGSAIFSLWLPEVYPTHARAGGFAFVTTIGRFAGAGLTFAIAALNDAVGLGNSLSLTAIFFGVGLPLLPLARETRGQAMPA